jgi:hypothetical protein
LSYKAAAVELGCNFLRRKPGAMAFKMNTNSTLSQPGSRATRLRAAVNYLVNKGTAAVVALTRVLAAYERNRKTDQQVSKN